MQNGKNKPEGNRELSISRLVRAPKRAGLESMDGTGSYKTLVGAKRFYKYDF